MSSHGIGQGSGASGTDWIFNSVSMFQVLQVRCAGCEMSSPHKQIKTSKHILGNVDDARQYTNDGIDNDLLHIMNKVTDALQTLE